jgi:membrane associated rhomboid family serine protease
LLTRVLIAINLIVYGWEYASGAQSSDPSLARHGALVGDYVQNGEWWRIFTAAFLHGPPMHILFNMIALWQVGGMVETVYGTLRMAVLYVLSALGSGLLVTVWDPHVATVGASGAIFGLFGAIVAAGIGMGPGGRQLVQGTVGVIILNLLIGFTLPNISNSGHIGGLIAGFLVGLVLFRKPRFQAQPVSVQPTYAQPVVDLRNDPGVVTIEQEPEPPREGTRP